jgi:hypothetical protein
MAAVRSVGCERKAASAPACTSPLRSRCPLLLRVGRTLLMMRSISAVFGCWEGEWQRRRREKKRGKKKRGTEAEAQQKNSWWKTKELDEEILIIRWRRQKQQQNCKTAHTNRNTAEVLFDTVKRA